MRGVLVAGLVALSISIPGAARAADPVEGLWQTQPDGGGFAHVALAPCGPKLCGRVTRTFHLDGTEYDTDLVGEYLVWDMLPVGGARYEGKVFQPSTGRTFLGRAELTGDRLKMSGCVLGGLICKSQTWARVK